MSATDVLSGKKQWDVARMDCLEFLRSLPDDAVSLCFFSPPYSNCRLYLENGEDLGIARDSEAWTAWMVEVFKECLRVCTGLVAAVVEDKTRKYRWGAGPALLMADLHRAGVHLRRPCIYHRVGIPGSGGPDYLRADTEFIVVASRQGRLPWSDPTAMGHIPKWQPGGQMSNRKKDGSRVNRLTVDQCFSLVQEYAHASKTDATQILCHLRSANDKKEVAKWFIGITKGFLQTGVLRSGVLLGNASQSAIEPEVGCQGQVGGKEDNQEGGMRDLWGDEESTHSPPGRESKEQCAGQPDRSVQFLSSEAASEVAAMFGLRETEQIKRILRDALHEIQKAWRSSFSEKPCGKNSRGANLGDCNSSGERNVGTVKKRLERGNAKGSCAYRAHTKRRDDGEMEDQGYTPPVLANPGNTIRPTYTADEVLGILAAAGVNDETAASLVHCKVGGGLMGSPLASVNEAPFPEDLATFFVRTFAAPGSVVLDCFAGSGTTGAVAVRHCRRFVGADIRESQALLSTRRIESETPMALLEGAE